jgi:hypothetical protein
VGAHPYWYIVAYEPDLQAVLERLRQREFRAGRYNPVMWLIPFPLTDASPSPGPAHPSIEKALEASDADGTRSILDISQIADERSMCAARPLSGEALHHLFGTAQPSRAAVEGNFDFFDDIERGEAIYIVLYDHGQPTEVLFAGYSFD